MILEKNSEVGLIIKEMIDNTIKYISDKRCDLDYKKVNKSFLNDYKRTEKQTNGAVKLVELSEKDFTSIPYNQNIKLKNNIKNLHVELQKYTIEKNVALALNYPIADNRLRCNHIYGYFNEDIKTFKVSVGGNIYMSPTIMEYETMKEPLSNAHGKVLTYGLGIGFFQYHCLLKDEVESVTVIEKNENVIKAFKEHILPQFNTNKQINIIQGDAFDYLGSYMDLFDYKFIDIHFNNNDGEELYKKFILAGVDFETVDYWIEEQILYETKIFLASYLNALYNGRVTEIICKQTDSQQLIKSIHRILRSKDIEIKTKDDVIELVNNKSLLREIIANTR